MIGLRIPPILSRFRLRSVFASTNNWRIILVFGIFCLYIWHYRKQDVISAQTATNAAVHPYSDTIRQYESSSDRLEINGKRADAVKEAFLHGWKGYKRFAFKHNELMPISRTGSDARAAWGATAVDSLTTAILMNIPDIIADVLDYIDTTEFLETDHQVSMFSSTKTFIGGMQSAHDLLTSDKVRLAHTPIKLNRLVEQVRVIADGLTFAFDTDSGLPQNYLFLKPEPQHRNVSVTDITAAGTLSLEWTHLSDSVKDPRYARLTANAENAIFNAFHTSNDKCEKLFDGLYGKVMDLHTGKFETFTGGFMSGSGSFYEYLLKMYIYSPTEYKAYRDRWIKAADAAIRHLSSHPSSRPDLTFLATYDCMELRYVTDHTTFFAAGNFILGGSVLHEQKYIDFGLRLVESQVAKHQATVTGLAPDRWTWLPKHCKGSAKHNTAECQLPVECGKQLEFYAEHGHCILDATSRIRPETLESLYYAYRITRNPKYQDMSWRIFQAINRTARIPSGGFSEIVDVNIVPEANGSKGRVDAMPTWIMGETLKYAWMIHADDDAEWHTNQDGKNKWVFNTQAHPLKVRAYN